MYRILLLDTGYLNTFDFRPATAFRVIKTTNEPGKIAAQIAKTEPDVVLIDSRFPDALKITARYQNEIFPVFVVVSPVEADAETVRAVFACGISDYWIQPTDMEKRLNELIPLLQKRRDQAERKQVNEELFAIAQDYLFFGIALNPSLSEAEIKKLYQSFSIQMPAKGNYVACIRGRFVDFPDSGSSIDQVELLQNRLGKQTLKYFGIANVKHMGSNYCHVFAIHLPDGLAEIRSFFEDMIQKFRKEMPGIVLKVGISKEINTYKDIPTGLESSWMIAQKNFSNEGEHVFCSTEFLRGKSRREVIIARDYIATHFAENITVGEIASALYLSASHLMHIFKEDQGCTLNEYITNYRIGVAKMMLQDRRYRIAEIAAKTGYKNAKYFSRVFQKVTGKTPSEYQRTVEKE